MRTLQTVVVHVDVATCDGKGERTGVRHSGSVLLIFPRIFGRMREEPDVESRHPAHDDECGPMTVGYRFQRGARLFEESAGDTDVHINRRIR